MLNSINLKEVDILTNNGFLRPITSEIIDKLSSKCVIPLMWETWEFREGELDLEACLDKEIKVYGTNEEDEGLRTKEYLGYMVLKLLLESNHTPIESNILLLGSNHFSIYIQKVLEQNGYKYTVINDYKEKKDVSLFDTIILAEHQNKDLLIAKDGYIATNEIMKSTDIIHICGNVDFSEANFNYIPKEPASFGYMSYTVDYMGINVVIDLHTAGLKVAQGMLKTNKMNLNKEDYKNFMQDNYPALSFENKKYW